MDKTNEHLLLNIINDAIESFNKNEQYLIKCNLSERCICAKFAQYLSASLKNSIYKNYTVDVEYNRNINSKSGIKSIGNKNIVVDLIVHKRGTNDNLICIEMKKACAPAKNIESDEDRLKKLTDSLHNYMYKMGALLLIQPDPENDLYNLSITKLFKNGSEFIIQ